MFPGALRMDEKEEEAAVAAVREVMRSKRLFRFFGVSPNPFQSSKVFEFERAFAAHMGATHGLAVNSGTSALICALIGLGIGPEDEVIVPAYTWFSTVSAVVAVGAVPVIADIDDSLTLDPVDVKRKISPYTRAIIAVHMRGAPAGMDRLMALASEQNLLLLEDAAQAVGASFQGRAVGSIGHAGAYSFHLSKILTAGEGGMVTTNDRTVYRRAAMYHDSAVCPHMGIPLEEWLPGVNLRMSELHAAVALIQLHRLDSIVQDMRERKARLKEAVSEDLTKKGVALRTIHDPEGDASIALIFFLPEKSRVKGFISALADENIPASPLYQEMKYLPHDHIDLHVFPAWTPILRKRAWSDRGGPWRRHPREIDYSETVCPKTMDFLRRAVHIDISPELDALQEEQMADGILKVVCKEV
jgi:8-amino-3,8-dideoxy-alpha-D-manno-octulosonate transaminase